MSVEDSNLKGPLSRWPEAWLVYLLCAVAGLRVFVYAAAFPFFNNVDEQPHFDLVMRYSRLQPPTAMTTYSPEAVPYFVIFGSPEYLFTPDQFRGGKYPPPNWHHPPDTARGSRDALSSLLLSQPNRESTGGPLYYLLAGAWMRLGECCGLDNIYLLYWIRFLNVFLAALLVWLGYLAARMLFPERRWLRLGVPLLLALFPQDIYYGIQSDVLSPLCFGAAFIGLARLLQTDTPSPRLGTVTGLALAAAWLVKISNLPLVAVAVLAVLVWCQSLAKSGKLSAARPALVLLLLGAALPIGGWCLWSLHAFGDLTGSSAKIQVLGWTRKPFLAWWQHPIFAPSGFWYFWSETMATFWRGEFVWHRQPMALPVADAFYAVSSMVLPGLAAAGLLRKSSNLTPAQRQVCWLALWSLAAAIAFLGFASIAFDFGPCVYPSRALPYFTSGRLLSGALIPFLLLYVWGLDQALSWTQSGAARILTLGGLGLLITLSELVVNLPAFASEYNWFHL